MKFFEILTQYDLQLEDGSYEVGSDSIVLTEDEYSDDLLKKLIESEYGEAVKVRTIDVREITPEEFSKLSQERIINQIIPNIYKENLNLPEHMTVREFIELRNNPSYNALALKQFEDKYYIYKMLKHDLDLTKISVAELFERIEKIYAARLTDEYLTVLNEAISK